MTELLLLDFNQPDLGAGIKTLNDTELDNLDFGVIGFDAGTSPVVYLLNQCEMIARYLRLAVWPSTTFPAAARSIASSGRET